jgi:Tol biopolymer transport system component
MNSKNGFAIIVFCLLFSQGVQAQFYNGYQMTFGKNRVQYEDRFWNFYKWKSFDTYFYLGGQELAIFTGRTAEAALEEIEKLIDFRLDGRIQFIIYNKLSDAKQSNIGLETDDNSNNIGGVTRIVGNKVFLYFTGDHEQLHRQIRAGIAKVLIDQMMYGGDVKERIQNSALLTLPDWYLSGLISYISQKWNTDIDNRVRDGITTKRYFKFNHLSGDDALYAGHSIWKYIIDMYGESSVSNLLYMTRVNRNVESGFMYVLGLSVKSLAENWKEAMTKMYANSDTGREQPAAESVVLKKPKSHLIYSQLKVSPDGRYAVYVTNDIGKYKIYLYDLVNNKKKKILRSGYRSYTQETDVSFPLMAWHPSGLVVTMIRERKGFLWLDFYTVNTKKWEHGKLFNFEKVLDFSYSPDGQSLVLSAVQKGQSDIFVYNLRTRTYDQVTKDFYDDLQPRFVNNGRAIAFASNRVHDTLDVDKRGLLPADNNFDIFYYDHTSRSKLLKRITNTTTYSEFQPMPYDSSHFAFLSDENGIVNRYTAHLDSMLSAVDTTEHYTMIVKTYPQTNYARNIISHDVNPQLNRVSEIFYQNGRFRMFVNPLKPASNEQSSLQNTLFRNEMNKLASITPAQKVQTKGEEQKPEVVDSNAVDIDNYVFQSDFPKAKNKKEEKKRAQMEELKKDTSTASADVKADSLGYVLPKERIYETAFSSNYFVAQLDNSLLNNSYQLFSGGGGVFFNPSLNGFFKIGISDLLDDYRIVGGFKLAGDLNSNEYFLTYENLKYRVDHQITFYRQARFATDGFSLNKIHTHEGRYFAKYPFSDVTSLRGSIAYRNDRLVFLSTDINNLQFPNLYLHWASTRLEFVFDNTLNKGLNLYNGTRTKLFAEYYRQIDEKQTNMYILGIDYRYYMKVHREIIWANRFAASTSFGDQKLIYYMGGTDSWISPRFNTETPIDYSQNYVYQTLATNMRGFDQNIRNGNSFVLVNSELRIPVFRYLLNRPIKSDFLRNFQVVGFGDVGTAWNGKSPYDSTNALNNKIITAGNFLTITVITQHDPLVGGYGFGLRSRVLGYFVRGDWAWGMQDGEVQPRKFYFSLSLDF